MSKKNFVIFVVSDSVGTTAINLANAARAQFNNLKCSVRSFPFVKNREDLEKILITALDQQAIVMFTFAKDSMSEFVEEFSALYGLDSFDILSPITKLIEGITGEQPTQETGALHRLDDDYFSRIKAVEFAVRFDDGKDPKGFSEADILLVGISRTSKTPLSLYLANENYKVANLPIMPESELPKELFEVDPANIVGLLNDEEVLLSFRQERMKSYGMDPDKSEYSNLQRIREEISYAENLFREIGCLTINVANKSIEETAAIILSNKQSNSHDSIEYHK